MKIHILNKQIFILIIFLNICNTQNIDININFTDNSYYYEEKYFRILSNNYDTIDPGNKWREEPEGFGFKARRDFGSLILLKDWSMYNFKLTKVVFRNQASFDYGKECDAEMWLIHTKDNGYYPPGRRIFIKQNYFIIVVPFVKTDDSNPATDSIFKVLNLEEYAKNINHTVFPKRPVKLYTIIQNQPSLLFEGNYRQTNTLFLVFTQYHFIAERDFNNLLYIYGNGTTTLEEVSFDNEAEYENKIFRNVRNIDEVKPKVTLMSYSLGKEENKAKYLESLLFFIIIFLF